MIQPKIYLQDFTPQQLQLGLSYDDQKCFDVTPQDADDPIQREKIQRIFNRSVCALSKTQQDCIAALYRERMPASIYQLYQNSIEARKVVSLIPASEINLPNANPALIEQCQKVYNVLTQYGIAQRVLHPLNIAKMREAVRDHISFLISVLSPKPSFSSVYSPRAS